MHSRSLTCMGLLALAVLAGCTNTKPSPTGGAGTPTRITSSKPLDGETTTNITPVALPKDFVLKGGGASFINPAMVKWTQEYEKLGKGYKVNYQSKGSSAGQKGAIDRSFHFGCSEAYLTDEMLKQAKEVGGDMLHLPLVMGAVVPTYNLPMVKIPLKFSQEVLADIFLGKIQKWNDPRLEALNPGVGLPNLEIKVFHRNDGSGTTFVFTDALSKFSKEWEGKVGRKNEVKWPVGEGAKGNEGVAGKVVRTQGGIGYNELSYALDAIKRSETIAFGRVQNKDGEYPEPNLASVTAAARNALLNKQIPSDLRFTLTNAPGKDSYPISGVSWALIYSRQPAEIKQALVDFLRWTASEEGQRLSSALGYAAIPQELAEAINKKLDSVNVQ